MDNFKIKKPIEFLLDPNFFRRQEVCNDIEIYYKGGKLNCMITSMRIMILPKDNLNLMTRKFIKDYQKTNLITIRKEED